MTWQRTFPPGLQDMLEFGFIEALTSFFGHARGGRSAVRAQIRSRRSFPPGHAGPLEDHGCAGGAYCRKYLGTESREKRNTVNVRTILLPAVVALGLASAGLGANYDDLIKQGYRWVAVDGPLACVSKDDLRQMVEKPSDEFTLKMVEEVRAYYLIRGSVVRVVVPALAHFCAMHEF